MLKFHGEGVTLATIARQSGFNCGICAGRVGMHDTGDLQPTVDHIIPVACGGANHADNLQLAHRVCNVKKRNRAGFICDPIDSPIAPSETVIFDY
jgi:5-methylcytosine-specific restriction endonuclease McrA